MTLRTCAISFARGFALRAFMVIAVLATAANAGSITYSSTALSADLRGAASAGASSVYGNLNGSGSPFGLLGASLVTLGTDPGWLVSAPNGFSEPLGIFVGTAFDFVSEVGVIWNGAGTILSTSSGLAFSAVDRFGNFGAIRNSDGASVVGTLNASGNIVSTNVIPRLPGELSGQTRAVDGTISGGSYGIPTGLQAWLAVSGNRINLQNL
ncbi:MAG TPA: hypothetical protein DEH78_09320, partial [Solibacterales bacterium]|nr:hypothetical protein [Bryobacterales bacterium]